MLSYWIVRDRNERPIGLARCEGDRVFLKLNAPLDASWYLLSDDAAVCIHPSEDAVLCGAFAVLGMREDRPVAFAAAPTAPSLAHCRAVKKRRNRTYRRRNRTNRRACKSSRKRRKRPILRTF